MASEPAIKRTVAFIDGQNLYYSAREAFGHRYPNYDVRALSVAICSRQGWDLRQVRFYTGIPDQADNPYWNGFWGWKLAAFGRMGVSTFTRFLRYRFRDIKLRDGTVQSMRVGEEKGIDVRIALDIIRLAHRGEYDVALVFSQDQDLAEAAEELRVIAREQGRWIRIASAFPVAPQSTNQRGINKTEWIRIEKAVYDACLDPRDYHQKPPQTKGNTP